MGTFITAPKVCEKLGVCRKTLEAWVKKGDFPPAFKLSARKFVWDTDDVDEFIKQKQA